MARSEQRTGFRRRTGILSLFLCMACGEPIVLESQDGVFHLEYDCASFQPVARSTSEYALIRQYAVRAVQYANGAGDLDAVRPMLAADAERRLDDLERLMVEYLCAGGGLADEVSTPREEARTSVANLPVEKTWEIGSLAPEFNLPALNPGYFTEDVDSLSLDDFRGQYLLLTFWATWCSPCIAEQMDLVPVWNRFKGRGFSVLGVLHRDEPERAWAWTQENIPGAFPTVVDDQGHLADEYGIRGIPRTFLIGPEGDIVQVLWGFAGTPRERTLQALEQLLPSGTTGTL